MQAQITLGLMLIIELVAGIYGYSYGDKETVRGMLLASLPIIFLPIFFPVTALLFFATSCGLNEQGELKRDTLVFKMTKFLYPKIVWEDEIRLCPTFWNMALGMALLGIAVFIIGGTFWVGIMRFTDPAVRAQIYSLLTLFTFIACYITVAAIALNETMESQVTYQYNKKSRISYNIDLSVMIFTITWFTAFLAATCEDARKYEALKLINPNNFYYYCYHSVGTAALWTLCVMSTIWVVHLMMHLGAMIGNRIKDSAIPNIAYAWYHRACPVLKIEKRK